MTVAANRATAVVTEAALHEHVVEARAPVRAGDERVLSDLAATTAFAFARHATTLSRAIWAREFLVIDPEK